MERQVSRRPRVRFRSVRRGYDPTQVDAYLGEITAMLRELEATVRRRGATIRLLERRLAELGDHMEGPGPGDPGRGSFDWAEARAEVRAALAEEGEDDDMVLAEMVLLDEANRPRESRYRRRSAHLPTLGLGTPPAFGRVFDGGRRFRFRPV